MSNIRFGLNGAIYFRYKIHIYGNQQSTDICVYMGPSIKYITLFLANFDPPLPPCHTLSHIPGPPRKYVTQLDHPDFYKA